MAANDRQVGGTHYKREGGEEHWDRVARLGLDYFQGQITKYVERWKLKNGIQDLEKARHFLDKYLEVEGAKERATPTPKHPSDAEHRAQAGAGPIDRYHTGRPGALTSQD